MKAGKLLFCSLYLNEIIFFFPGLIADFLVRDRVIGPGNFPSWATTDAIAKDFTVCPF